MRLGRVLAMALRQTTHSTTMELTPHAKMPGMYL